MASRFATDRTRRFEPTGLNNGATPALMRFEPELNRKSRMKRLAPLLTIFSLAASGVWADECQAEFALTKGTGYFTSLKLFNFGQHFELQADTPSQAPAEQFVAEIDGAPLDVHVSFGLDDLLVVVASDPGGVEASPELLDQLSKGSSFALSANSGGKAQRSEFSLAGSAASIRRLKAGCR